MSWLSTLAKIGGVIAAPFSGGASLALTGLGTAGDILGKQQGGAAQGRMAEGQMTQAQDRNAIDLYGAQQGAQDRAAQLDLQRKGFSQQSQGNAFQKALIAQLMGGSSPTSVSVPGITNARVSGGMGAALQNPAVLDLLKKIASTYETTATTPLQFSGGDLINAPSLTALPTQSGGSKFLDILARVGQIGGGLAPLIPQKKPPMPPQGGDWGGYG